MKNSPLLKFGVALVFALSAGSMIYAPANAESFKEVIEKHRTPLTYEQLEKKAPNLHSLFVYYTNYGSITKEQFLKYIRTHKELRDAAKKHKRSIWFSSVKTLTDDELEKRDLDFDELVHLYSGQEQISQVQFLNYVDSHKDLK